MYAKIFSQIYDGTLCTKGPWQALVTFQQLLVLADKNGVVDMTAAAISRRTTIPLEIIETGISALLQDDPESRTPTEGGRRIVPLSTDRNWGWSIVNYSHYRALKREEERREYHKNYWRSSRSKVGAQQETQLNSTRLNTTQQTQQTQPNQPIAEAEAEAVNLNTLRLSKDNLRVSSSPAAKTIPPCPVMKVVEAYHAALPTLSAVAVMSANRRKLLTTRWRELYAADVFKTQDEGVKYFEEFFAYVARSEFLTGRTEPRNGGRPFAADFEWLVRPQNFIKVVEGKYHG